jgi:hypothetical protein
VRFPSLFFTSALLLSVSAYSLAQTSQFSAKTESGFYIAQIIAVPETNQDSYVSCLRQKSLPLWQGLKRDLVLQDSSTYELITIYDSDPNVPNWNFLLLFHLTPETKPHDYLQRVKSLDDKSCAGQVGAKTLRMEVLRPTPNSSYPRATPEDDREAIQSKVEYGVEYIAVRNMPEDLNAYREIMSSSLGPAVGKVLIPKGLTFGLTALETVSVEYSAEGMPSWNQIHINATLPSHHLTAEERDSAILQVNPKSGGNTEIVERLDQIRTKPRVDKVRELYELAVR